MSQEFLLLTGTKPVNEYIDGQILLKIMLKTRHSRLQSKLITAINKVAEPKQIAYAFPELRCTFGDRSIVPDIAVFYWQNIEQDSNGELLDDVFKAPNWTIEILSPEQSSNRVTGNILHCLKYGCQLGWLIDPSDRSIMIFQPQQQPELFRGKDKLAVLPDIELELTVSQIYNWLKMTAE